MEEQAKYSKRWYDRDPEIATTVEILNGFPDEIQTIIADGVIMLAEKDYRANRLIGSFKRLGADKTMGLFKSQLKKRCSDRNRKVHKALNYYYILPDEERKLIAGQLMELYSFVYQYFERCKETESKPSPKELATLTRTFVENGGDEVQRFLKTANEKFSQGILYQIRGYPSLKEVVKEANGDMRMTR